MNAQPYSNYNPSMKKDDPPVMPFVGVGGMMPFGGFEGMEGFGGLPFGF